MDKLEQSKQATQEHIQVVQRLVRRVIEEVTTRAVEHDASKLESPELELFAEWGPKLKEMEYGSDEYKAALKEMGVALDHHYTHNRHHPEFFPNGVDGMNIIDLIEMVCDWKAATLRMKDGNFLESLEVQRKRFNLSPQLVRIFANSDGLLDRALK